jgi:hypothetical protein
MNHKLILQNLIISSLYSKQLESKELFSSLPLSDQSRQQTDLLISEVATVHLINEDYFFRLRDSIQPDLYFPFFNTSKCFLFLNQNIQKSFQLLHLPVFQPEPFHLQLFPLLTCSETFNLLFSVLYDYHFDEKNKSQESVLVVFDFLRLISRSENFTLSQTPFPPVSAQSIEKLSFDSFEIAFQTPIQIGNSPAHSFLELISMIGEIGNTVLIEMNIGFIPIQQEARKTEHIQSQSSHIKDSILQQFSALQDHFLSEENENESLVECPICHSNEEDSIFAFPVQINASNLPLFLDSIQSQLEVDCLSTCNHIFHYSCLSECQLSCPICRKSFNAIIPKINLYSPLDDSQTSIVSNFLQNLKNHILFSFSFMFTILDFRERNQSNTIYSKEYPNIFSIFYSLLWYRNQIKPIQQTDIDQLENTSNSHFIQFIFNTLQTQNPLSIIQEQVHSLGKELNEENLFIFLRRVLFFQAFVLSKSEDFDWQNELTFESLCKRYNFNISVSRPLPAFPMISLPNRFLDFARSPYNVPLFFQDQARYICLLDGTFVKESDEDKIDFPSIFQFLQKNYSFCSFPIPFLVLSGKNVTKTAFFDTHGHRIFEDPIYTDKLGIPDLEFQRGKFVEISRTRLSKLIERFLVQKF